jgi:hypothetical protein
MMQVQQVLPGWVVIYGILIKKRIAPADAGVHTLSNEFKSKYGLEIR